MTPRPLILACQRCPTMVSLGDFDGYFHLWDDGEEARIVLDGGACIPLGWRLDEGQIICPTHHQTDGCEHDFRITEAAGHVGVLCAKCGASRALSDERKTGV